MGCDIHAHVELKLADGRWHHMNAPHVDRNYALFTKLAGVRQHGDEITPFSEPRGLPEDISEVTALLRKLEGADGHSDSWISRSEIRDLETWWNDRMRPYQAERFEHHRVFELSVMGGYLDGNGYGYELPPGVEDVRLVFWFDN